MGAATGVPNGFFATFCSWLNAQMATYIGDNTARLANVLEPAFVTCATLYVMAWGYLHLTGQVQEPVLVGLRRIALLALVFGVGLHLWLYNTVIVDTFYNAPAQLAGAVVGASDPVTTIDVIWEQGGSVAGQLSGKASILSGDFGLRIAAFIVWALVGLVCVYTMFLIALANVALAVLLALGPLFIALSLFDATRRLFSAWISQLATYALVTVLTVMVAALLLRIVQSYATQTAALGAAVMTVDALNMVLVAVLVFLVMRQVMPIAAGLAGGLALNSFGTLSATMRWGGRNAVPATRVALAVERSWRQPNAQPGPASTRSPLAQNENSML